MRRAVAVVVGLLLGACGGGGGSDSPADTLEQAERELAGIERADMRLALLASAGADGGAATAGFEVDGPFDVDVEEGSLPVARLTVTRIAGEERQESTLLSTGSAAFVQVGGESYRLGDDAAARLRVVNAGDGGLEMSISDWFVAPKRAGDGRITGSLDVPKALNDVFLVAAGLGAAEEREPLQGEEAERVRRLARESSVELVTDEDGRPTRLRWSVTFEPGDDERLRQALGDLGAAALSFDLQLSDVGKAVRVEAPADAKPAPSSGR